jgi:hypothetical protein
MAARNLHTVRFSEVVKKRGVDTELGAKVTVPSNIALPPTPPGTAAM